MPAVETPSVSPDALVGLAGRLHLLADPTRLRLIFELAEGESFVGELVAAIGVAQPLLSHHLQLLRISGLVESERRGQFAYYRLTDSGREMHTAVASMIS